MSQKNETTILGLALLLTVGIVGGGVWWFTNGSAVKIGNTIIPNQETGSNSSLQDRISFGEKTLTSGNISPAKKEGVQAIAAKSYEKAIANFTAALKLNRNDPEALIFLNNARIASSKSYTIVASVPLGTDPNAALEILRGIAQAQNQVNSSGGVKGVPLRVGIANR
ncbi:tetratricopeptide repeat protein [Nostoc sp.]|uniref:tetratricopeptide repeat protein n=1 Tax=Nostoc sp. TaxID=1180 RepID=UPI002FFA70E3